MINYIIHFYRYDKMAMDKKPVLAENSDQAVAWLLDHAKKWQVKIDKISVETANPKCKGIQKYCDVCFKKQASYYVKKNKFPNEKIWYCSECFKNQSLKGEIK